MLTKENFRRLRRNPKEVIKIAIKRILFNQKVKLFKIPAKFYKKKKNGFSKFTVVSAVYGVEKYLDDYFNSIINQNLNFKKNIQLILVDDGSLDNSKDIIKKWQNLYPNNITYIYKENGGQASARNLGLQYVKTPWVTFIDPDDFIDPSYFVSIDNYLEKNKKLDFSMLSCNMFFYFEKNNFYRDDHPLNYRFKKTQFLENQNLENFIQLSAGTALFKTDNILKFNCYFPEDIKSTFEDATFVNEYLLSCAKDDKIVFIKEAIYYYRKREDNSSTVNQSWNHLDTYGNTLEYGYLPLLKKSVEKLGFVPFNIKFLILYHISWHFKHLVNKPQRADFLNNDQKEKYLNLIDNIFEYYDFDFILNFNSKLLNFYYKMGVINCFKKENMPYEILNIVDFDKEKRAICIKYFNKSESNIEIKIDGNKHPILHKKSISHNFLTRIFTYETKFWVYLPKNCETIEVFIDKKIARIGNNGIDYDKFDLSLIEKNLLDFDNTIDKNTWFFIDKDLHADDNAEHLYRYVKTNHPEKEIFFALRKESKDWDRLEQDGFNLVDFSTLKCDNAFKKSSKIISSHIDGYVINYFRQNTLKHRKFVFLQHGITKDDISTWLNDKKIDLFITATNQEFNSIIEDNNRYKFSTKEVVLSGFPRHDRLIENNISNTKQILVMPTWRKSIVGKIAGKNYNERELNQDFLNTQYAQHWLGFLKSPKLKELCTKYDFELAFNPHPNIKPYLEIMDLPDYIKTIEGQTIQKLFQESAFLITDYSSVAFDMAILNKTVLYYQFDEDEFFAGTHTYSKGYYDYRKDGFGPVCIDENSLLIETENILKNDGKISKKYEDIVNNTFCFQDTNNSKRVYKAILNLD